MTDNQSLNDIKRAVLAGRTLRNTFGGKIGGGEDIFQIALDAIAAMGELSDSTVQLDSGEISIGPLRIKAGQVSPNLAPQAELEIQAGRSGGCGHCKVEFRPVDKTSEILDNLKDMIVQDISVALQLNEGMLRKDVAKAIYHAVKPYIQTTKPVSVSQCAKALYENINGQASYVGPYEEFFGATVIDGQYDLKDGAKAVLNAAGVAHVD